MVVLYCTPRVSFGPVQTKDVKMSQCEFCEASVDPTTNTCTSCGAAQSTGSPQPAPAAAAQPAAPAPASVDAAPVAYTTYSEVPWYRKSWFGIVTFLLFPLITLYLVFSGSVYYEKKGELKTWSRTGSKIIVVIWLIAQVGRALKDG
jgi:hypothetical protein